MHKMSQGKLIIVLLAAGVIASACTQTYSQAPLATPTLISTGLFVSPFPSGQDPLKVVADLGTQTAAAKTAAAGGATMPATSAAISGTPATPAAASQTATLGNAVTSAPTTLAGSTVVPAAKSPTPKAVASISTSSVSAPSSYTLQAGEFPYCIARRFNINPDQLLSANGITDGSILYPGKALTIPASAGPFPGDRALHDHPDTYTVSSSDTTIYGVACYYGDVHPQDIASANGISLSSSLKAGQQLAIP